MRNKRSGMKELENRKNIKRIKDKYIDYEMKSRSEKRWGKERGMKGR